MKMLIVDDHDIFRQSLAMLLSQQADFEVLAHFNRVDALLRHNDLVQPGCILLDYHLPGESSINSLSAIKKRWPAAFLVFLTGTRSVAILKRILASPVEGVLHKSDNIELMLAMLRQLAVGQCAVSPTIKADIDALDFDLTTKEFDILVLLTQGQAPIEIADTLCLSKRTIEKHKENIMRKTGVHNLAQLIELGNRLVLVD